MTPLRAVGRDLRALGAGAPLRAAYEGSKLLGGHAVAFGALARRPPSTFTSAPVFELPEPPPSAVDRVRTAADRIAAGTVVLFGQDVAVGEEPDWHLSHDPAAPEVRWGDEPWWRLDLRSQARVADVKWTWELGRHRHLVLLARAAGTESPDPAWAVALNRHLNSWLDQNPPEHGVHWYSNLEIALRAMAWLEILQRAGDHLEPAVRGRMDEHLHHAGSHLLLDLPYTVSTMRNNHLIGDAVGLVVLARAFAADPRTRTWAQTGERLLVRQVAREVRPDGSMIEDSVSYHRFVLELLSRRVLLGSPPPTVRSALHRGAGFLIRLGVGDGGVPQYGDWDEGRALTSTNDPHDPAGTALLGLALSARGAPAAWREEYDEVAWYVGDGVPNPPAVRQEDGHDLGAAMARAERGPVTAWLKAGGGPWHGHADHSSVSVRLDDEWLVGDPGTGNYNGPDLGRAFLRSSEAHAVLVLDGEDQLVPHRAFRWVYQATGRVGPPMACADGQVMWCAHNAYGRLDPGRRVARAVVVRPSGVVVVDWVEGPGGARWQLALPLAPGSSWKDPSIVTGTGAAAALTFVSGGGVDLTAGTGPWSETYGSTEPSTRLVATGRVDGPVAWSLDTGDAPVDVALDGGKVQIGGTTLALEWLVGAATLTVDDPGAGPQTRTVVLT